MQNIIMWSFFHRIPLTLLGGMWKNCSAMELSQILTHKLLINDSDKCFKRPSMLIRCKIWKPVNRSALLTNWPVSKWKQVFTNRNIWIDHRKIKILGTWKLVITNYDEEGISITPHYHFHPLHRHLDISRAITAESSPLHIGSSRTRPGNL